eukprot:Skav212774  [mRNA]  locus=scaffold159:129286:138221:- [translate_table: standard]
MSKHATLVFSRHVRHRKNLRWNVANIFTGWVDVDLSEKGLGEAKGAGELLKAPLWKDGPFMLSSQAEGLQIDVAYTSYLKRSLVVSHGTGAPASTWEAADQYYIPVNKTWRLNERMYGDRHAKVKKHGADQVGRQVLDPVPPCALQDNKYHPCHEAKYKDLDPKDLPDTECLKDTIARVMPYWEQTIAPALKEGKTVFVAAHGNSIRAIVKMIEGISDDVIPGLEIPTGTPLVYELDKAGLGADMDLKPLPTPLAVEPLKFGRYLGDAEPRLESSFGVDQASKIGDTLGLFNR